MAGLLIVCADEYAFIIALDNLLIDRAVEEYDGNVLRLGEVDDVLSCVVRAGVNNVDDKHRAALCKSGLNLLGLRGLVAVCVIVVEGVSAVGEDLVHCRADGGDVRVAERIVQNGNLTLVLVLVAGIAGLTSG